MFNFDEKSMHFTRQLPQAQTKRLLVSEKWTDGRIETIVIFKSE